MAFAAVVLAQTPDQTYTNQLGYFFNHVEVPKSNGLGQINQQVFSTDWPTNATTLTLWLRIITQYNAVSAGGAAVDFWVFEGSVPATLGNPWMSKTASQSFPTLHYQVQSMTTSNIYVMVRSTTCSTCSSTMEALVGLLWVWSAPAPAAAPAATLRGRPFQSRDNSYTVQQAIGNHMYGATAMVQVSKFNLYVAVSGPSLDKTLVVVSTTIPQDGVDDPTTKAVTANWQVFPGMAGSTGNYQSPAVITADGMWYVTPYVVNLNVPSTSSTNMDYALGYGHVPSAASTATPSIVILVLVAAALLKAF